MKHKIPMADGDEVDAFCKYSRRIIIALVRPGVAKKAKRKYNRRERRALNRNLDEQID